MRRLLFAAALLPLVFIARPALGAESTPSPKPAPAASASPSAAPSASPAPPLQFRNLGPAVGRVTTVAGTDLDPALLYAGAAGGGVWRSTNGGADWSPVFDAQSTQSIGAIAIDPRDVKSVWVGTGEPWPRNDVIPGDGIYHSSDGGKTWAHLGLEKTSQIARVLIDPRHPQRIVVAALGDPFRDNDERGVFRSTDGGRTWTKTLFRGPGVGASDLAMDPRNPDVLYAGMWRFRRNAWSLASGGAGGGLFKSTDGGATWTELHAPGLPKGDTGRIALAIAPSDAKRIYALIQSTDGLLWRSDDGGASWAMTSANTLINERPFYYSRIVVDPHDANHLFSVSVLLAESHNGGKTWQRSGKRLHGDHHDLWISADGTRIVEANDGGVGLSRDNGKTWTWQTTLPLAQFYHVATDRATPYRICGGLQDNGLWCAPSRTGDPRGILQQDWTEIGGGDGTSVVPDPQDPMTIYGAAAGGDNAGATVRYDIRTHTAVDISVYERDQNVVAPERLAYRFNWETPLAFDPHASHVLYTAGNVVFRSRDRGMHWTPISPDLTRNIHARQQLSGGTLTLDVTGAETYDTVLALAPSPAAAGEIWAGTDDGLVKLTRDGGAHWSDVTPPGLDPDARVATIDAGRRAAGVAYVAVDRHFVGDRSPYVYATSDFGRTWRTIVRGLSAEVHAVREDPANPNVLYAGTGKGVWWSRDAGASWERFPAPLPPVEVRDLIVQPDRGDLIVATHGRGIYVFDDLAALRDARSADVVFAPLRAARPLERLTPTVNARGYDDAPVVPITFWQRTKAARDPVVAIVDASGRVVRRFAGTHDDEDGTPVPAVRNDAGWVRLAWNLTADPPVPWRRVAPWNRGPEDGAPVPAGRYMVRLIRDGVTYAQPLEVAAWPQSPSRAVERDSFAFIGAADALLSRLDTALNGLDNVRLQLAETLKATRDPQVAERARGTLAHAQELERAISSQPVNDQDNDFLEDLLRERVLTFRNNLSIAGITAAQRHEADALQREGSAALARYEAFVARDVEPLNLALRAAGLAVVRLDAVPPSQKPDPDADEHARRGDQ